MAGTRPVNTISIIANAQNAAIAPAAPERLLQPVVAWTLEDPIAVACADGSAELAKRGGIDVFAMLARVSWLPSHPGQGEHRYPGNDTVWPAQMGNGVRLVTPAGTLWSSASAVPSGASLACVTCARDLHSSYNATPGTQKKAATEGGPKGRNDP